MKISRRNALAKIGTLAGTPALLGISGSVWQGDSPEKTKTDAKLKGRVQHSVCRWPYGSVSLEKLCEASVEMGIDRKSTRLNSSHVAISYAVFCVKKKIVTHLSVTDEI